MYRIKEETIHTLDIEKSRFITYLARVCDESEAKSYILSIQKEHPNANHHCYCFMIGAHNEIQRSNDNGEPSGTAGVPMLESLRKHHMQDIVAITVRYFGGIKLGAGGLIRAYSHSVSEALKVASITQTIKSQRYTIRFTYEWIGLLDHYFRQHNIDVLEKTYEEDVTYIFRTPHECTKALCEISNGRVSPVWMQEDIIEEDIKTPF